MMTSAFDFEQREQSSLGVEGAIPIMWSQASFAYVPILHRSRWFQALSTSSSVTAIIVMTLILSLFISLFKILSRIPAVWSHCRTKIVGYNDLSGGFITYRLSWIYQAAITPKYPPSELKALSQLREAKPTSLISQFRIGADYDKRFRLRAAWLQDPEWSFPLDLFAQVFLAYPLFEVIAAPRSRANASWVEASQLIFSLCLFMYCSRPENVSCLLWMQALYY